MNPPLKVWVAGARPRTLPAAVVPVVVGTAAGYLSSGRSVLHGLQPNGSCAAQCFITFSREVSWLNALLASSRAAARNPIGTPAHNARPQSYE